MRGAKPKFANERQQFTEFKGIVALENRYAVFNAKVTPRQAWFGLGVWEGDITGAQSCQVSRRAPALRHVMRQRSRVFTLARGRKWHLMDISTMPANPAKTGQKNNRWTETPKP